jgi:rhamnulokinase
VAIAVTRAPRVCAAVDLGAGSGRVMAGRVDDGVLSLETVHRFPNGARVVDGRLRWPMRKLYEEVLDGLARLVERYPQVESIGVDTWGVDYALLDGEGRLLAEPVSYRDDRTASVVDAVHRVVPPEELFALNGLQVLPFTTLYQLAAERAGPLWNEAATVVMLPDLLTYWLTGTLRTERTIASTTGLLDVTSREWSTTVLERLGIDPGRLPPLVPPGTVIGPVRPEVRARLGAPGDIVVVAVGTHDTASAVAAVPVAGADEGRFAYVSSGTWSLVGVEVGQPILTNEARRENFTNELGVDGRIRFLRNTGGLWLIDESVRWWAGQAGSGDRPDLARLLAEAADLPDGGPCIDVDDPFFLAPGAMPERIAAAAARAGQGPPQTPAQVVRCVIDSLARAYATATERSAQLSGTAVKVLHLVGGGSRNRLLAQATASAVGLPVLAGPPEATALGNVLVQARALGAVPDSSRAARAMVRAMANVERYEPR